MRRGTVEHVRAGCIVPPGAIWLPPSRTTAPTPVGGLEPRCASRREAAVIRSGPQLRQPPVPRGRGVVAFDVPPACTALTVTGATQNSTNPGSPHGRHG